MAKFNYGRVSDRAHKLLERFGASVDIKIAVAGEYDPETGITTTPKTYNGIGAVFDYESKDIDGTLIMSNDRRVYASVVGLPDSISTAAKLVFNGDTYSIITVKKLDPSGMNVLWELQVRK